MKHKILAVLFLAQIVVNVYAQKSGRKSNDNKCKVVFDKEINRESYENTDTQAVFADTLISDNLFVSEEFKFKVSKRNHKEKEWVKFTYMVEKNGTTTFLKIIMPKGDEEVEKEAKRIVSLIPLYKPAMCGQEAVPIIATIQFPMRVN